MNLDKLAKQMKKNSVHELDAILFGMDYFINNGYGTKEDYFNIKSPEDIAFEYINELQNVPLNKVKFAIIDDEYIEYLNKNKFKDTDEIRTKYAHELSDEKRNELWVKNEFDYAYDWGFLPLVVVNPDPDKKDSETSYVLSNATTNKIKKLIHKEFKDYNEDGITYDIPLNDFYVSPYLFNIDDLEDVEIATFLFEQGEAKLHGEKVKIEKNKVKQNFYQDEPFALLGIMVVYRYKVPCILDTNYFEKEKYKTIDLPDLPNEEIHELIHEEFKYDFDIMTRCLIYYEEFDEVIQDFTQAIAEAVEMKLDAIDKFAEIDNKHTMHTNSTKKRKRNTNF